jgi:hemolysin activation/secretion protein
MTYLRGSYQFPVNGQGTRLGVAGSDMHSRLGKDLARLEAEGDAQVGSLYAMHPFIRSRTFNLYAQLQYDHLKLNDTINATATVVDKRLDNWSAGVNGDFQDGFASVNSFSAAYTAGDLHLDPVSGTLDAATARSAGSFSRWNLSWLRLQRLTDTVSLFFSATGQFASKNLDSSQKLSLGGVYGVRAYPPNEAPGDEGYLATLEARYDLPVSLPGAWQLAVFLDTGHVTLNKDVWSAGANSRTLSGAGFGLNAALARDWYLKASLAWKLGAGRPVSDVDRSPRVWFQAGRYF